MNEDEKKMSVCSFVLEICVLFDKGLENEKKEKIGNGMKRNITKHMQYRQFSSFLELNYNDASKNSFQFGNSI